MDPKSKKQITIWLTSACLLIFLMVIIGGVTRLTQSGLSMVEWHPISGVIPPINETEWKLSLKNINNTPNTKN